MDEDAGVQQVERARGDCAVPVPSMGEAQAAAKHAAALRALHDASQVVGVLGDLLHEVQASAEREAREAFVASKREEARAGGVAQRRAARREEEEEEELDLNDLFDELPQRVDDLAADDSVCGDEGEALV